MKLTATEFRKRLFPLLERVASGEMIEVVYKGTVVKITPGQSSSKLARLKRQHALLCDPDSIVESDRELMTEMESEWKKDWDKL